METGIYPSHEKILACTSNFFFVIIPRSPHKCVWWCKFNFNICSLTNDDKIIFLDLQLNLDPALSSKQLQLKKNKLADTLNDKLANRPGPLQLLQNGIIEPNLSKAVKEFELDETASPPPLPPVEGQSTSGVQAEKVDFSGVPEISLQSSESFDYNGVPIQRHSIAGSSPSIEMFRMETSPGSSETMPLYTSGGDNRKFSESSISPAPSPGGSLDESKSPEKSPRGFNSTFPPALKSSLSAGVITAMTKCPPPSLTRKKQKKKYRKLRYHEYVPPSKSTPKGGKTNSKPPSQSDSPYSALLQQQQLFLQLQLLQQQYPNGILMQKLPDMINTMTKDQKALAIAAVKGRISVTSPSDMPLRHSSLPQILPVDMPNKHNASSVRFEELKVNDLKASCKELGMIVSGKKADLVERLMDNNKGVLPASALPDNPIKDNRRQAFSLTGHMSSVDSQFSLSPSSPTSSPVFKFPSERENGTSSGGPKQQSGLVQLPDVFPSSTLHKEFNEIMERQKRQYICQKGISEKSIAPRPELSELLAFKLLPPATTATTATTSSSSSNNTPAQMDQRQKGLTYSSGGHTTVVVSKPQLRMIVTDKSSTSLPSSPRPESPSVQPQMLEQMESSESELTRTTFVTVSSSCNPFTNISSSSDASQSQQQTNFSSVPVMGPRDVHVLNSSHNQQVGGIIDSLSQLPGSGITTSFYQQQQHMSSLHGGAGGGGGGGGGGKNQANVRPGRSSVPAQPNHATESGGHSSSTGLPTYNSIMRSRNIVSPHPNMGGGGGGGVMVSLHK